jgi:hypothetical protein
MRQRREGASLVREVMAMAGTLTPPGLARVTPCGECDARGHYRSGRRCFGCRGTGKTLWHACPACGNTGYDRLPDRTYACRTGCGYRWTEDDPGWQAQRLPDSPV